MDSLNVRYCGLVKACRLFPTEGASLRCLSCQTFLNPEEIGRVKWAMLWKPVRWRLRYHIRRPVPGPGEPLDDKDRNAINEMATSPLYVWHD